MRPVQIMDKPAAVPYVCLNCGAGSERQFFVDLGLDIEMGKMDEYNTAYHSFGVIYLCSECICSVIVEFNRKLPEFLRHQLISKGFLVDANKDEIKTLQDEVSMLRGRLNAVDEENQTLRFSLLSKVDQENEVLSPPSPDAPTAEDLVNQMLGNDTDGNSAGTTDSDVDGHDPSTAGNNSSTESNDPSSASDERDSLDVTHQALGNFGAAFPPGS